MAGVAGARLVDIAAHAVVVGVGVALVVLVAVRARERAEVARRQVAVAAVEVPVGPAVDRATTVDLRDSVLYVSAKDPAWHREIERSMPLIEKRLTSLLGDCAVRKIQLRE